MLTDQNGAQLLLSEVAVHNSQGIGEHYHEPVRQTYRKIVFSQPTISPQFILRVVVKAVNGTMGDYGSVPSRLVSGILTRFSRLSIELPNQTERM